MNANLTGGGNEQRNLPWKDVEASRSDRRLQRRNPIAHGKTQYLATTSACPSCQTAPDKLIWFYFESPPEAWEMLCGCAGWMVVCDKCRRQISFFQEVIS